MAILKRNSAAVAVGFALLLCGLGLGLATVAGAEGEPSVRQGGYGEETCDSDEQALDTRITAKPKKKTTKKSAKLGFESFFCNFPEEGPDPSAVAFTCKLDGASEPCTSPQVYKRLKKGKHKFEVSSAFNDGFGGDPTPAKYVWKVRPKT